MYMKKKTYESILFANIRSKLVQTFNVYHSPGMIAARVPTAHNTRHYFQRAAAARAPVFLQFTTKYYVLLVRDCVNI